MDEKELLRKFHDRHFLKKNEFAEMVSKIVAFVKANKTLVTVIVVVAVVLGIGVPTLRWYQAYRVTEFNTRLFEAEKSLKKIDLYEKIIDEYGDIPASQYARLKLVENLVEHNQFNEAMTQLDEGLKKSSGPNIFSTLIVLKQLNLLKNQNKYLEASDYATNHQNNILKRYLPQYKLLQANLMILARKKDEARALYQKIIAESEVLDESNSSPSGLGSTPAVREAKEQLMLIELGVF